MTVVLTALAPVVLLIALGYGLRRSGLVPDASWSAVERLTYFVLFPALLVSRVSAQGVPTGLGSAAAVTVMTVLTVAALLLALRPAFRRLSGPAYTALFQGGVRFNTYLSFAMAEGLLGAGALAPLAWLAAVMILMINVLCVLAFARWGQGKALPSAVADALALLGSAALPLGLLAVGAALRAPRKATELQPLVASSVVQFTVKPALALGLAAALAVPAPLQGVLLMLFCVPTATSAYILAQQLGGDGPATAAVITGQTVLALGVTPFLLATFLAV
jgi:malonate transporter